jgi:ribosomal protein S18 acetylase RimI-like enzyme
MDGIKISEFRMEDYDRVYALWKAVFPVNTDSSYDRDSVKRFLERNPGTSFIAGDGERLAGAVLAGNDGRRGYIHHLGVLEEYRGRGVGRRLMFAAEAALGRLGISKVHLFDFENNTSAKAFYRKLGYAERNDMAVFSHGLE